MESISSPCTGVCTLDPASALCVGCARSAAEIARWLSLTETERLAIMAELPARRPGTRPGEPVSTQKSPPSDSP